MYSSTLTLASVYDEFAYRNLIFFMYYYLYLVLSFISKEVHDDTCIDYGDMGILFCYETDEFVSFSH